MKNMDKKIRILHILGSANFGGTELTTSRLITRMSDEFYNSVCFLSKKGPVGEGLESQGINVYYLPIEGISSIIQTFLLYKILVNNNFHILHLYGLKANLIGRILGKLAGIKVIVGGLRSLYPFNNAPKKLAFLLDKLTFSLSQGYISNSKSAVEFLVKNGYNREKFWVIHNGINIEEFSLSLNRESIKQHYKLPLSKPVITCVANLRSEKGHKDLILALNYLKKAGKTFVALFIGEGEMEQDLINSVKSLNLDNDILFLGSRSTKEIANLLSVTDIFVLSSLREGLPTSIIEAMASGCPVVATRVGGVPELVVDGETGFLITPGDVKELTLKLMLLLNNSELRANMGMAGKSRAVTQFSLHKMVAEYESLYKNLFNFYYKGI
uniref:Glycosyltransferase n=1 Tax=candidate division CPR3 bacterium TaxID=2268181 RepID=A0A7C5UT94_UNCC3